MEEGEGQELQAAFIEILKSRAVLLSKSQLPDVRTKKTAALKEAIEKLRERFGLEFSEGQLSKKIQNMKARVKTKIDSMKTGNKPVTLKPWEKELLEIMSNMDSEANTSLKAQYWSNTRNSLKKNIIVSGQDVKSGKFYAYLEQPNFCERETSSNTGDEVRSQDLSGDDEENYNAENNETQQLAVQVNSPVNEQTLSTPTQKGSVQYPTQSKKPKLSLKRTNPPKTAAATVLEYIMKGNQPPDPVDAFLSGIAPSLKKLPPRYWHYAKAEIFATVQKYELEMLMAEESGAGSSVVSHLSTPICTVESSRSVVRDETEELTTIKSQQEASLKNYFDHFSKGININQD